jgi:hypothetical protein
MTDVFDLTETSGTYSATASPYPAGTSITAANASIQFADTAPARPTRSAAWWAAETRGFDWTAADRVPADLYNEIQWEGLKPGLPYPVQRSGVDLRRCVVTQADINR